jgi:hypothetical protein
LALFGRPRSASIKRALPVIPAGTLMLVPSVPTWKLMLA